MTPTPKSGPPMAGAGRGRSLRTQLVAWNILALALLLGVLGGVARYTVRTTIMASVDRELARQVQPPDRRPPPFQGDRPPPRQADTQADNNGLPPGANGPPTFGGGPGGPTPSDRRPPPDGQGQDGGPPPNDDRPDGPPPPAGDRDAQNPYHPRFFNLTGHPRFPTDAAWDRDALAQAGQGQTVFSNVTVGGVPLRVVTRPVPPTGPPHGTVQAAYPLTDVRRAMAGVDRALLILTPVALLCAGLAGATLTGRVLGRVRLMTQAAGRISGRDFAARLPVAGGDEFAALAATFNGMLGRQQEAFERQQALIEQQRRFTADASHELKTPLTIIKGNTSMALSAPPDPSEFHQSLQEIDRAADTMQRLVQDLLLLARSDNRQLGRDPVELLLREVLERAVRSVPRRPEAAPVRLVLADDALSVRGNEDELTRLFGNLLDNAARHTPPGGAITVHARRDGAAVVVVVADTGPGIAPEHLPHLGERFYRVDSARARRDGGTGLGLSICRSIAEAHGGGLSFASAPGAGTTARVALPRA